MLDAAQVYFLNKRRCNADSDEGDKERYPDPAHPERCVAQAFPARASRYLLGEFPHRADRPLLQPRGWG